MDKDALRKLLAHPDVGFVEKLRVAAALELDYWDLRTDPPNVSVHVFRLLLPQIPLRVQVRFVPRESTSGRHGDNGEDDVFKFEFSIFKLGKRKTYFVKGYFFDKGNCRGVCIQSCREVPSGMRIVRN